MQFRALSARTDSQAISSQPIPPLPCARQSFREAHAIAATTANAPGMPDLSMTSHYVLLVQAIWSSGLFSIAKRKAHLTS